MKGGVWNVLFVSSKSALNLLKALRMNMVGSVDYLQAWM